VSGQTGQPEDSAAGNDINACAAAWIERRDRDDWSADDQAEFDVWLMKSVEHRAAYWRLEAAWQDAERLSAFRTYRPSRPARRILPLLFKAVAALALIGVFAGTAFMHAGQPHTQTYATTIGGREVLTLDDGSRIELNTNTVLRIEKGGDVRKVWLDKGEAYFDIVHNVHRHFVVIAGNRRVTDLGTKFVVRRENDNLHVAVLDGQVRVSDTENNGKTANTLLKAGQVAVATAKTITQTTAPIAQLADDLSWQRGVLVFDNATLSHIAREFNRYNRTKLMIPDRAVGQIRIAGTFRTDNLDAFVQTVRQVLMLHAERRDGQIIISR
jgi:transmembrane sensor